jgi:hypothetical protein
MYTGPFAILLGVLLVASLFGGLLALAANACESIWCVVGTALVDTAAHIIVVALLFEPIRKHVEALNRHGTRVGLLRILRAKNRRMQELSALDAVSRQVDDLRMWMASLTPTVLRLSDMEIDSWMAMDSAVGWYPFQRGDDAVLNALERFISLLEQRLPSGNWPKWLPFQPA